MGKARSGPSVRGSRKKPRFPPRQHEQKLVSRPQMMARERILHQLQDLIAACEELFAEHGAACCCEVCCLVSNLIGSMRVFKMILEIS